MRFNGQDFLLMLETIGETEKSLNTEPVRTCIEFTWKIQDLCFWVPDIYPAFLAIYNYFFFFFCLYLYFYIVYVLFICNYIFKINPVCMRYEKV